VTFFVQMQPRKTAEWGTVAVGKTADLVVLRGNPLVDIANTRAVAAVVATAGTTRLASSIVCGFVSWSWQGSDHHI